jgi:tetratricopeptide (TPR) repeat protein
MLGSGLAFAEASTETTLDYLDAYAAAWAEARTEACSRRDVTQQWDADTAERAQWCLAQARDELDVLADELRRGEPTVVRESVRLSAGLIRFDACLDALALRRLPVPPSEQQESVRAVRRELARARAVSELGRPVDALSIARQCLADSEALGWPPLDAAARTRVGKLLETTGDSAQAETELEAAYFIAVKAHAYSEASIAAEGLVYTVGVTLDRHEEGLRWARHAEVMREQLPDPEGIRLAAALTNRASVHSARGELERSRALQEEALALFERAVGPDHPLVGGSLHSLAAIATWQGDYARSLRLGERALANREHVLGPDHPEVATTRIGLAGVYYTLGDSDRARVTVEAGLSSLERALGPDHPDLARGLGLIGALHKSEGAYAEARIAFERALRINETAFGSEHPDVALALDNVALVAQLDGDFDGARRMYERSRSIVEQRLGPEHVAIAYPLLGLCEVALAQGRTADAVALAQRAVDVRDAGSPASERAHARFTLARAQWATGTDRERAIQAAQTALEMYRSSAGDEAQAIAQIEAWLSEHTLGGAQNSDN